MKRLRVRMTVALGWFTSFVPIPLHAQDPIIGALGPNARLNDRGVPAFATASTDLAEVLDPGRAGRSAIRVPSPNDARHASSTSPQETLP
jgi:hypothetical protein